MKKETMLNNLDQEIEYFKKCIEDLEFYKTLMKELDDEFDMTNINSNITEDSKLLCIFHDNSKYYDLLFSKISHLYTKRITTK